MEVQKPPNTINLMVGHYYEDYYEYLSFIKQGQKGHLFLTNLFTNDDPTKVFLSWGIYSMMGYIAFITHIIIPVWIIYWLFVVLFSFIYFLLTYITISEVLKGKTFRLKISAFILVITASPLFNISVTNGFTITPFDYWYSPGTPFSRYNMGTPHHQLIQIIFLAGIILMVKVLRKGIYLRSIIFSLFSLLLLVTSPPQLFLFWVAIPAAYFLNNLIDEIRKDNVKKNIIGVLLRSLWPIVPLIFICTFIIPLALFFNRMALQSPTMVSARLWDIKSFYYPPIQIFFLSTGFLAFLALGGLVFYLYKPTVLKLTFLLIFLIGSVITLIPLYFKEINLVALLGVHNLRFFNPASYIFLGTSAILVIERVAKKSLRKIMVLCSVILIFFISLGTLWWERINYKFSSTGNIQYMPEGLYQRLGQLEKSSHKNTVLTSPSSGMGLIIPAMTGRRVYYGRSIFTLNLEEKAKKTVDFYNMKMVPAKALEFLNKEGIGSVVVLKGVDTDENELKKYYPFLNKEYSNTELAILTVKP